MGGYSDYLKDVEHTQFLKKWTPEGEKLPEPTPENLRWNIARARAAEAELKEIRQTLADFKRLLR